MRRHSAMDFVAGVMVFPGGGVDDRDRHADIAWVGPDPAWWAQRLGVDTDLAEALVCAAARETFEESGVLFAGPADDPQGIVGDASVYRDSRAALADNTLSFADFLRSENLVLRADLLRPWANWVTPEEERTRRYDTYFFVGALPEGQRADGENTETDRAGWITPEEALDDFAAGRNFLLPPTWTRWTRWRAAPSPRCWRWNARSCRCSRTWPSATATGRSSSSTATATTRHAIGGRRRATATRYQTLDHERVRQHPGQRRATRHRHAGAVAAADQRDDPPGVPRDHRARPPNWAGATILPR